MKRYILVLKDNKQDDVLKEINTIRKQNKNTWCGITLLYKDEVLHIKIFNTWIQPIRESNKYFSGVMDAKVKQFTENILRGLNLIILNN
jgi:uncharacterized ferritin-like protein (DUF455 family)